MKLMFFTEISSYTCKAYAFWQDCRADVNTSQAFLMFFLATSSCTCKTEGKTQFDISDVKKLVVLLKFCSATCSCTCKSHIKVQVGRANVENTTCFEKWEAQGPKSKVLLNVFNVFLGDIEFDM